MYPEDLIDAAIDYVKSFDIWMTTVMRNSLSSQEKEPKVKRDPCASASKGICAEKIDQALEKCWQEEDSTEAIRALIRKKSGSFTGVRPQIQRL